MLIKVSDDGRVSMDPKYADGTKAETKDLPQAITTNIDTPVRACIFEIH